jgi:hypothetical protein
MLGQALKRRATLQRLTQPSGRLSDTPRIAHHLGEKEVPPPFALLVLAQDRRDVGARRISPESVGRDDG